MERKSLRTPQREDVIGLKVQAMFTDPERRAQEQNDIDRLMAEYGRRLDWDRIEESMMCLVLPRPVLSFSVFLLH